MQKRYAEFAEHVEPATLVGGALAEVARQSPGDAVNDDGAKTFLLARRWQYRRLDRSGSESLLSEEQLNAIGADGWELAGVTTDAAGTHYFLKRGRGSAAAG